MPLQGPATEIAREQIQQLLKDGVAENKRLDYKLKIDFSKTSQSPERRSWRDDLRMDVTALANTEGGYLVFGMSEEKGFPTALHGFDLGRKTTEQCEQEIHRTLDNAISPKLTGISVAAMGLRDRKAVAVIHVPKSYRPPHQVHLESNNLVFCHRVGRDNVQMEVDDLRREILSNSNFADKAREFRARRVNEISCPGAPHGVAMTGEARISYHLIPLDAFAPGNTIDIRNASFKPCDSGQGWIKHNWQSLTRFSLDGWFQHETS